MQSGKNLTGFNRALIKGLCRPNHWGCVSYHPTLAQSSTFSTIFICKCTKSSWIISKLLKITRGQIKHNDYFGGWFMLSFSLQALKIRGNIKPLQITARRVQSSHRLSEISSKRELPTQTWKESSSLSLDGYYIRGNSFTPITHPVSFRTWAPL